MRKIHARQTIRDATDTLDGGLAQAASPTDSNLQSWAMISLGGHWMSGGPLALGQPLVRGCCHVSNSERRLDQLFESILRCSLYCILRLRQELPISNEM